MPKVAYFLPPSILKRLQKNSLILISFFKMRADMTAVTIQSNKIVSNEVKALLYSSYKKKSK